MVYENLRFVKVLKFFLCWVFIGKLIEDIFFYFEIKKMGFICMFIGKIIKDSFFLKLFWLYLLLGNGI